MSSFRLNNSATYLLSLLFVYVGCIHADEVIFTELAVPSDQPNAKFIELYNGNRINDVMNDDLVIYFYNGVSSQSFWIFNGFFDENGLMTVCADQNAFQQAYGKECDYLDSDLLGLTGDSRLVVSSDSISVRNSLSLHQESEALIHLFHRSFLYSFMSRIRIMEILFQLIILAKIYLYLSRTNILMHREEQ